MEENIDSKYEFNAPKYMDFLQGDVDQDADKWFGKFKPLSKHTFLGPAIWQFHHYLQYISIYFISSSG